MSTLHSCGSRRFTIALLALAVVISGMGSALLPSGHTALAADGVALGDAVILAGPGGQYGILTVAPAGSSLSVDGDPVDGYYPVTFDGVGGWTATGLIDTGGKGNGGNGNGGKNTSNRTSANGNGGVETVSADPVYSDGSAPAETSANAEPITGGAYGPGGSSYSEEQIIDIIYEAADNYGQSRDAMLRVARCESGLNPSAVGGGGSYYGLFQFVPSTFAQTPYGEYDIFDPWANANAAAWTWSEVGRGSWSCQ
ncbi:MAG: transglycosylase SLT domain-containing protein [Thermomicrobiales bacterium]|nr:transglycosylase SLT domain-containing protein [Thermomicrobiales bacterium]